MKIIFDGREIVGNENAKNLVEFLDEQGVEITAPCYRSGRVGGCCSGCGVEVDGKEAFACAVKPREGMQVVYSREDLINERKQKFIAFEATLRAGKTNTCCKCSCTEG